MTPDRETLEKAVEEIIGDNLADPNTHPRLFAYQMKLVNHVLKRRQEKS